MSSDRGCQTRGCGSSPIRRWPDKGQSSQITSAPPSLNQRQTRGTEDAHRMELRLESCPCALLSRESSACDAARASLSRCLRVADPVRAGSSRGLGKWRGSQAQNTARGRQGSEEWMEHAGGWCIAHVCRQSDRHEQPIGTRSAQRESPTLSPANCLRTHLHMVGRSHHGVFTRVSRLVSSLVFCVRLLLLMRRLLVSFVS